VIVALVPDLMDRSRIAAALPDAVFVRDVGSCAEATVVLVDLGRHGGDVGALRAMAPEARIVAFGSHVDDDGLTRARAEGADLVFPRSQFFRDPAAALGV
jgi:hypothetical protein